MRLRLELSKARREYRAIETNPNISKRGEMRQYWRNRCDQLVMQINQRFSTRRSP